MRQSCGSVAVRAGASRCDRSSAVQPEERCALAIGDAQTCTGDIPGSALMAGDAMCARRGEWEQREGVVTSYSHFVSGSPPVSLNSNFRARKNRITASPACPDCFPTRRTRRNRVMSANFGSCERIVKKDYIIGLPTVPPVPWVGQTVLPWFFFCGCSQPLPAQRRTNWPLSW